MHIKQDISKIKKCEFIWKQLQENKMEFQLIVN